MDKSTMSVNWVGTERGGRNWGWSLRANYRGDVKAVLDILTAWHLLPFYLQESDIPNSHKQYFISSGLNMEKDLCDSTKAVKIS